MAAFGGALLVIGPFLPWFYSSGTLGPRYVSGLNVFEGKIQLVIGIVAFALSILAWRANLTGRTLGLLALLAGIASGVTAAVAFSGASRSLSAVGSPEFAMLGQAMRPTINVTLGWYVSIAGAVILGICGLNNLIGGKD